MHVQRYRARWLFPVDADPIENGTIEIDAAGRIAAIHDKHDPRAIDLGPVAIIPGLVNAHTHLEFSDLKKPLGPQEPFTDWIRAVVAHRRSRTADCDEIVEKGLTELAATGTTLAGEIATHDPAQTPSAAAAPQLVAFRELLGLRDDQIDEQLDIARRHLTSAPPDSTGRLIPAISPHAPYSVHPQLFHRLVDLAAERGAPLAMHLAETQAELELLDRGAGPFVEMLSQFGVWREGVIAGGTRPLDYLLPMARLRRGLVIHGNYLADDELDLLAANPNLTVVYCPRTHAWFRHQPHPWRKMLARGIQVAVGTDSRASNPDLSLWRELCFLHERHPGVDPRMLLELGTIAGARALGLEKETGTLRRGKRCDLAVIKLGSPSAGGPCADLFHPRNQVVGTMSAGRWLHRSW